MEVVAGPRNAEREEHLRRLLVRFDLLLFDAAVDFDAAARGRRCRRAGVTPRGLVDDMVAAGARHHRATLAQDFDLGRVVTVVGIEIDDASTVTVEG